MVASPATRQVTALSLEPRNSREGENGGVHEDDVGHHHERGEASQNFTADRDPARFEAKEAIEHYDSLSGSSSGTTRRATVMKPVWATMRWKGRTESPSMFHGRKSVSKVSRRL